MDQIFLKNTRTRKAKQLTRYEKAKVTGKSERNIVPLQLKKRKTRVALNNIKRTPQVVLYDAAGPSCSRTQSGDPESRAESMKISDEGTNSSDQE